MDNKEHPTSSALNPHLDALEDIQKKIDELQAQREGVREEIRGNMVGAVVVFLDMVGSTEFKVTHIAEPWVWILQLRQFTQVVTEYVKRLNGHVAKYIGDEVMAVFQGEDSIHNAMNLVSRVNQIEVDLTRVTSLQTRIKVALDKGPVYFLKFEGHEALDPQGSAVDRCARIAKFAKPGTVLASGDVARDSGVAYKWTLAGEVPVKGLGPISIFQLGKATLQIKEHIEVVKADHDDLLRRAETQSARLEELEKQYEILIQKNWALQREVRAAGATPSSDNSEEEASEEVDTYEKLVDGVRKALRPLPAAVVEAFYYKYYGQPYQPEPYEDSKWEGIRKSQEYLYLEETGDGFVPNEKDMKVQTAAKSLKALHRFLSSDVSSEFHERFAADHQYEADFRNRGYWEGQLGM
ncbi:MAG: adenylate/guanylate cyclase domain-containing protein [Planctomycetes bacterium]|nr:adenylate/guanylate cyclase domain-containing protein [Planctomycetota bacterium]